jgi:hypothetical protein
MAVPGIVLAGVSGIAIAAAPAAIVPVVALYAANAAIRTAAEVEAARVRTLDSQALADIREKLGEISDRFGLLNGDTTTLLEEIGAMKQIFSDSLKRLEGEEEIGLAETIYRQEQGLNALALTINNEPVGGVVESSKALWYATVEAPDGL